MQLLRAALILVIGISVMAANAGTPLTQVEMASLVGGGDCETCTGTCDCGVTNNCVSSGTNCTGGTKKGSVTCCKSVTSGRTDCSQSGPGTVACYETVPCTYDGSYGGAPIYPVPPGVIYCRPGTGTAQPTLACFGGTAANDCI